MGRNAITMTKDELKKKLMETALKAAADESHKKEISEGSFVRIPHILANNHAKIKKDLAKITFGTEYVSIDEKAFKLAGLQTLDTGFSFLGLLCNAEDEHPVFCIIYHDGKSLRGYVPESGNVFNPYTRAAFGRGCDNEDGIDYDLKWYLENTIMIDEDLEELDPEESSDHGMLSVDEHLEEVNFDWQELEDDIKGRISIPGVTIASAPKSKGSKTCAPVYVFCAYDSKDDLIEGTVVVVSPKKYWEEEGCCYDQHASRAVSNELEKHGFCEEMEATFMGKEMNAKEITAVLSANPMFEYDKKFEDFIKKYM